MSPSILTEDEEDEGLVKKGRTSFASREAEFKKLALDDQQTLALNELLLQVTEMKKRTTKLELDNSFLRSQVRVSKGDLGSETGADETECDANFIDCHGHNHCWHWMCNTVSLSHTLLTNVLHSTQS